MKKRVLSLILAAAMVLGMFPTPVFAEETTHAHSYVEGVCEGCGETAQTEAPAQEVPTTEVPATEAPTEEVPTTQAPTEPHVHSGGMATCQSEAVCEGCGEPYGELGGHSYDAEGHCVLCGTNCAHESAENGACLSCGMTLTQVDEAVEAVRAAINALPTVDTVKAMTEEEQDALLETIFSIEDAYLSLTEDQRAVLAAEYARMMALVEVLYADVSAYETTHSHPVCGETCSHTGSTHNDLTWVGITSLDDIEEDGNYYLKNDIDLTSMYTVSYNVNLCLNGHKITCSDADGDLIFMSYKKSLTITDCAPGTHYGKWNEDGTAYNVTDTNPGGVCDIITGGLLLGGKVNVNNSQANFAMYGCNIVGSRASGVDVNGIFTLNGGGIYGCGNSGVEVQDNGSFTMNGGTISGNTTAYSGGGVYNVGTFTMNGGTIFGNTAKDNGGGVLQDGTFTMNGGTVSGNEATNCGGGIAVANGCSMQLSGAPVISGNAADFLGDNVFLYLNAAIQIGGPLTYTDPITVFAAVLGEGVITSGWGEKMSGAEWSNYFTPEQGGAIYPKTADGKTELYFHEHNLEYTLNDAKDTITASCSCGTSGTCTVKVPENAVYNGDDQKIVLEYGDDWPGITAVVTYSILNGAGEEVDATWGTWAPGDYIARIFFDDTQVGSVSYMVSPKPITVKAKDQTILDAEDAQPLEDPDQVEITAGSLAEGDTFDEVRLEVIENPDGTLSLQPTVTIWYPENPSLDLTDCYDITYQNGTLTKVAPWHPSSMMIPRSITPLWRQR